MLEARSLLTSILVLLVAGPAVAQVELRFSSPAALPYYIQVPSSPSVDSPLLIAVHGTSRNAYAMATTFAPWAEQYGAVLIAPIFHKSVYEYYQRLWKTGLGRRSDEMLSLLIDELGEELGVATDSALLFGYSGGGQFVHRYAMAHPERVAAAVVASPGWYTFPDPDVEYAYGTGPTDRIDLDFRPFDYLRVPMLVTVGSDDTERDSSLRTGFVDRQQGWNRYERAVNWQAAMSDRADAFGVPRNVDLYILQGAGHSFSGNVKDYGLDGIAADFLLGGGAN